ADLDLVIADSMSLGQGMQTRMQRIEATSDVSRGIGTDLTIEPVLGEFQRLAWDSGRVGYRVSCAEAVIEGTWIAPDQPRWLPAPSGSFHPARDIVGTMVPFWDARLTVNGVVAMGQPYPDPWWEERL